MRTPKKSKIYTSVSKTVLTLTGAFLLCLLLWALTACHHEETSQSLTFTSNGDGTCRVSGIGAVDAAEIVIPAVSPDGEKVTAIDNYAFMMAPVEKVTVPDTVTSIGIAAFYDCAELKAIELPDSIKTIGYNAFYCCSSLTEISLPAKLTSLAADTFYGCHALKKVVLPQALSEIGESAFFGCTALYEVYAVSSETQETEGWLRFPEGLKKIGKSAFYGCHAFRAVSLPEELVEIGSDAFYQCEGIKGVYVEDLSAYCGINFHNMAASPLFYAENLYLQDVKITELVIPQNVMTVKDYAFTHASSLISVTIPVSVKSIGDGAFHNCHSLEHVYYEGSSSGWDSVHVGKFNEDLKDAPVHYGK